MVGSQGLASNVDGVIFWLQVSSLRYPKPEAICFLFHQFLLSLSAFMGHIAEAPGPVLPRWCLWGRLFSWLTCWIHLDSLFSSTLQVILNFQLVRRAALASSPRYWSLASVQQRWRCIVCDTDEMLKVQSE